MMGFIYNRVISIRRPSNVGSVGERGYSAQRGSVDEAVRFSDVQCSIQEQSGGPKSPVGLPSGMKIQPQWRVFIPEFVATPKGIVRGAVKQADVIVDEDGNRSEVFAPIFTSLGWEIVCVQMEI